MLPEPQSLLEHFFLFGLVPSAVEKGFYIPYLVVLSYVIATLGSFTGVRLATNIHTATSKKLKEMFHFGGAFAFGAGIWSMHFIGMLAYKMDMAISYDAFLTILSMVIAVVIAYGVLLILRSKKLNIVWLVVGAVLLGTAICAMHYTGMAAMEMDGDLRYIPSLFFLSFAIAVTASGAALWIIFMLARHRGRWKLVWQILAAVIMGAAICGMHYTGMAASVFIPWADCRYDPEQRFDELALAVAIASSIIFAVALILSLDKSDIAAAKQKSAYSGNAAFLHLSGLLAVFLVLLVGSYVFLSNHAIKQHNNSALLNAVGLQRMLATRYIYHISVMVSAQGAENWEEVIKNNKAAQKDQKTIETNYAGFLDGGEITLNLKGDRTLNTHPFTDETVRAKLRTAQAEWRRLTRLATAALQADVKTIVDDPQYAALDQQLFMTVQAQDEAVLAIEDYFEEGNDSLIWKQRVMLAAGVVTFLLALLYARYFIANSIDKSRKELEEHRANLQKMVLEKTADLMKEKNKAERFNDRLKENLQLLEKAHNEAKRANMVKSEFLANMSHELRTPLNSIIGLTQMILEDRQVKDDQRDMVENVHKSAVNLLNIVNDVLDLSKIESGNIILEEITFDFQDIVSNIIDSMAPIASQKGISLQCSFIDEQLPYVVGDPLRVSRILTNLISNAIKYTDKGKININIRREATPQTSEDKTLRYGENGVQVSVKTEKLDDMKIEIYCEVTDTGIGIPKDKHDVIFEKFSQADVSTTRKYGGTGLGLSITKDLVEMMGGTIGVKSKVGEGSTFWFRIPFTIADETMLSAEGNRAAIIERDKSKAYLQSAEARILVAEDHLLNQDFISRLLKRFGFKHIEIVENGQLALDIYNNKEIDLILMDCHMPQKNGYEATDEIRKSKKKEADSIPIIALTADAMKGTREKCLDAGMSDYLSKPIDSDELREILSQWVIFGQDESAKDKKKQSGDDKQFPADLSMLNDYAETPEEIKEFVEIFLRQSQESLDILKDNCVDGECEEWVQAAHKLKGGAGMLGAETLRKICADAQGMSEATGKERKAKLEEMLGAYGKVEKYLIEATV